MNVNVISMLIIISIYSNTTAFSRETNIRKFIHNIGRQNCCRNVWFTNRNRCSGVSCTNLCNEKTYCGPNTKCLATYNTRTCECLSGFEGNAYSTTGCIKKSAEPSCHGDWDCANDEKCIKGNCSTLACNKQSFCGINAKCFASNHTCACECLPGLDGDPYGSGCRKQTIIITGPNCRWDEDCAKNEKCIEGNCSKGCNKIMSCGDNAKCFIANHNCTCECSPGFIEDPYGNGCYKPNLEPHCNHHHDCAHHEMCIRGKCSSECERTSSICATTVKCSIINRTCDCRCLLKSDGSSDSLEIEDAGFPSSSERECKDDTNCPYDKACNNYKCTPVCDNCGPMANCTARNHIAICTSINERRHCYNDDHCNYPEVCVDGRCESPCNRCGPNADCNWRKFPGFCKCQSGYTGNPYSIDGCVKSWKFMKDCHDSRTCEDNESCMNGKCMNPCKKKFACGLNSNCSANDHNYTCSCRPGFGGDPYSYQGCRRYN